MHKLDINHTKICLKLAQMHGYDDLWAKSMKNLLLTAFNPSLVWWLLFIQELLLHWLGTALHMWQGPCQGWITTRLKTREIFQMKLVFWRPSGWAWKAIVKFHWIGTAKNDSGDTVVSNSAKTIALHEGPSYTVLTTIKESLRQFESWRGLLPNFIINFMFGSLK